jgi:hypothetical protein
LALTNSISKVSRKNGAEKSSFELAGARGFGSKKKPDIIATEKKNLLGPWHVLEYMQWTCCKKKKQRKERDNNNEWMVV